ncbi:hypothetical protein [Evansella tamaricis]|uniref:Uncharacterized protein n=1 Tax=Evansella tamaricis TaxID=2069301 RepID=A0ABS6JCY0_9BACI|nr:hypothetical protein [Evansella tamaricis]MBU9711054.1 hypothetical protein [Evansella tamaricis]
MIFPVNLSDFENLRDQGKTVIYKESTEFVDHMEGWTFWSNRKTEDEEIFIYRKIVTFEEAELYELER